MRLPCITALLVALAAAPALAMEAAPDESVEEDSEADSYIPNRFAITLHGEWAHFNQHRDVEDTGGGGLRVGFRVNRWVEIELGADFYQTNLDAHDDGGNVHDLGEVRYFPVYAELRIDVTNIDKAIPWPWPWCRPMLIGGGGFGVRHLRKEIDPPVELKGRRTGVIVRGGAAVEFGTVESRIAVGVEWIYTWVGNDIRVSDPNGTIPSRINLDYWTLGAYVVLRF